MLRWAALVRAQVLLTPAKQTTRLQNTSGQPFALLQQVGQGQPLATLQARQQVEIGAGEQADVVGVLPVNAFKTFGKNDLNACQFFGGGAVLARRAFAIATPRHQDAITGLSKGLLSQGLADSTRQSM